MAGTWANAAHQPRSEETLRSPATPFAGDDPIGIKCHLCARELRDDDDLAAQNHRLVHSICCDDE